LSLILAGVVAVVFLVADQVTKYLVSTNMQIGDTITVDFIKRILDLHYIENDGGAWGMMGGKTWILVAVTAVIIVLLAVLMVKNAQKSKLFFWSCCLIISGGIGNMIDRVFNDGLVVDFLRFTFIDFPVFNVADIAVCTGAGLLILYFLLDILKESKEKRANPEKEQE